PGVTVISADSRSAILSIDGVQSTYTLTRDYGSGGFSAPEKRRLTISKGAAGHYWVTGLVNGYSVPFMVDTGATTIAMNAQQAQRLGIDFKSKGSPVMVSTAIGTEIASGVYLIRVKLGAIKVLGGGALDVGGECAT